MHASAASFCVSFLLNAVWQVPVVYLAARLASRLLRPVGPLAEHRVWVTACLAELCLPACQLRMGDPMAWLHLNPPNGASVSVLFGPGIPGPGGSARRVLTAGALVMWGVWTLLATLRLAHGLRATRELAASATPLTLSADAASRWQQAMAHLPPPRRPGLAASPAVSGPVTLGMRRPLLLLPPDFARDVSLDDLSATFAHELAHVVRRDVLWQFVYRLLLLPLDWHPVLRRSARHVADSRELVCDAMAAAAVGDPRRYALSLLHLAAAMPAALPDASAAIGFLHPRNFERRIMTLTRPSRRATAARRALLVTASVTIALLTASGALALRLDGTAAEAAQSDSSGPRHVSASDMTPRKKSGAVPEYPAEARKQKIQGKVVLGLIVNANGEPEGVRVVESPSPLLSTSAIDAVRTWRWEPFRVDGQAVPVDTTINVTYSLGG